MVLAIGLVVDDAIVVVENVYRGIKSGRSPVQAALIGAREIVGPIISMTITLAAVYAPVGFLSGVTGALFREFAFTLASSVLLSGVVALTLSPMMCSVLLKDAVRAGRFQRLVEHILHDLTERYARLLHGTLNYRPVTLVFAAGVIAILVLEYSAARKELAPDEDQGFLFSIMKAPQTVNLDYMVNYVQRVYEAAKPILADTELSFFVAGSPDYSQGFAGFVLKPWKERKRSSADIQNSLQQKIASEVAGASTFVLLPPSLPGNDFGLPVQMVVSTTNGYDKLYDYMEKIRKSRARKQAVRRRRQRFELQRSDGKSAYRSREGERSRSDDAIHRRHALPDGGREFHQPVQSAGSFLRGHRPGSEGEPPHPEKLTEFYVRTGSGTLVPLSTVVSISTTTQPNALTRYNQLNSATFSAVIYPGRTMGEGVAFLKKVAGEILPRDYQRDFPFEFTSIYPGRQFSDRDLRLFPHRDLFGIGGTVRKLARSPRHPCKRADGTMRSHVSTLLRRRDVEYLY